MNPATQLKETTCWMVFLGLLQFSWPAYRTSKQWRVQNFEASRKETKTSDAPTAPPELKQGVPVLSLKRDLSFVAWRIQKIGDPGDVDEPKSKHLKGYSKTWGGFNKTQPTGVFS